MSDRQKLYNGGERRELSLMPSHAVAISFSAPSGVSENAEIFKSEGLI